MGDLNIQDKAKLLDAERKAIIEPWMSLGSPTTVQAVHDNVQEKVGWNPSWNTVKKDIELFEKNGWVQSMSMPGGQVIWKPNENKLKEFKKVDFQEIIFESKGKDKKG